MSPPSPIPVARPLPNLAATLSAMVAGVVVLSLWLGHFSQVRGSTGAWLALHVERVLLVGDFQAAAGTSMIPNTIYDPLYPAMVAGLCAIWPGGADPVWVGHAVSAASLVLGGCLLVGLWRHIGGWPTALLASLSLAFPPLVSTAGMVRYDLLAVALVLGVAGLGSTAVGRVGLWRWAWVGLLAGLAYDTREFMLAPAGGALVALALLGLTVWQPRKERATARVVASLGTAEQPVGRAWDEVNRLPDGSRIAWFGPDAWRYYPLYGRRLQHQPVPVTDNGSAWRPLHEWWRDIEGDWWHCPGNQTFAQMGLPADTTGLVDNLLARRVDYVFVTGWEDGELPVQHFILEESEHAEAVYDDGCSAIWRMTP